MKPSRTETNMDKCFYNCGMRKPLVNVKQNLKGTMRKIGQLSHNRNLKLL